MPEFKSYRADTMQEALQQVKQELGPDALILHTRQIPIRSRIPWQKDRMVTEIVAVIEEQSPAHEQLVSEVAELQTIDSHDQRQSQEELPAAPDLSTYQNPARTIDQNRLRHPFSETARTEKKTKPIESNRSLPTQELQDASQLEEFVKQRLDSLQVMVEQLTAQVQTGVTWDIPKELTPLYQQLCEAEVENVLVRGYLDRLKQWNIGQERFDPEAARNKLFSLIETDVQSRGPIELNTGLRKIVALVGPTGVGKTTTIAKLAANFKLNENIRMGLVTVDTYRIAAVEQLRTYADIINLPMKVVTTSAEMKQAIDEFADKDLVFIDTAGRSPRDEMKLQELQNVLSEIIVDEIHLVLSATTSFRHLENTVKQFRCIHPDAALLTKLDEAPGLGAIINASAKLGLPLSYFTTGQNVPHDIEPVHPTRATRLLFGEDVIP